MHKKASYKRPVVTIIKLDPRQAILAVCQSPAGTNAAWISGVTPAAYQCWTFSGTGSARCVHSPRGSGRMPQAGTGSNVDAGS